MLGNEASAAVVTVLSSAVSRTSSYNGSWAAKPQAEGQALVLLVIGTVTGTSPTLDLKLQDADDSSGTNSADVSFGGFPQVTVGTTTYQMVVDVKKLRPYLRVVGTIGGTTPNITAGVFLIARPKSF